MGSPPQGSAGQYNKRREMDVMKLLMSDWKVELVNDSTKELEVDFEGPPGSPYEGGLWKVRVELPDSYPYKSPSIGFKNKIYHPNVDEAAGSVCLDVINQTWSPLFELINVFEVFLPQLLLYPNPKDPLNGDAAALLIREPEVFNSKVRGYVQKYAPNPNKPVEASAEKGPATVDSSCEQAQPSTDPDIREGNNETQGGDSDSDDDMSGLLSDSDEE